jgi:hypothetical protein
MLFCDSASVFYDLFTVVMTAVYIGYLRPPPVLSEPWLAGEYLGQPIHLYLMAMMEAQHYVAMSVCVIWEVVVDDI